ncbi:MAG TPA: hypothetical protein VGM15_02030, partial [Burkholderiaceae bacterium]
MTVQDCCSTDARKGNGAYDLAVIGAGSAGFSAAIASRRVEAQRNLFLLCSTVIAALSGTLACVLFG